MTALLGMLLTGGLIAGCGFLDGSRDTRPRSDLDTLTSELAQLSGVADAHRGVAGAISVQLSDDAAADELDETAGRAFSLVNDFRYRTAPNVSFRSGRFDATIPVVEPGTIYDPPPMPPALELIPHLRTLPEVVHGTVAYLADGPSPTPVARLTLTDDADITRWVEDVTVQLRDLLLIVERPRTDAEPAVPAIEAPDHDDNVLRYQISLREPALHSTLVDLHERLRGSPALLTEFVGTSTGATEELTLQVPETSDVRPVIDRMEQSEALVGDTELIISTDAGVRVSRDDPELDEYLSVVEPIAARGGAARNLSPRTDSLVVIVPDAKSLRAVAAYMSSDEWPLSPEVKVAFYRGAHTGGGSSYRADSAADSVEVLAGMWEAGRDDVKIHIDTAANPPGTDIDLVDFDPAPDQAERDMLIRLLRGVDWKDSASIEIRGPDGTLQFLSTADGTAENAELQTRNSSSEPRGWAADFIDAWDASAG